jgi:hypothetical protein
MHPTASSSCHESAQQHLTGEDSRKTTTGKAKQGRGDVELWLTSVWNLLSHRYRDVLMGL